jgi:uncharacterized membrane protein
VTRWTEERMDRVIAVLLRSGVLLAGGLVLAGAAIHLARHGGEPADFRVFRAAPQELRGPAGILRLALGGTGRGLILLGLLVLVATPVARVVFSVFAFAAQRDRTYVLVALVVLAALAVSFFGMRP